VPQKDKRLLQRWGHRAVAFSLNSDCVEVTLFKGEDNKDRITDTVVMRLGEYFCV